MLLMIFLNLIHFKNTVPQILIDHVIRRVRSANFTVKMQITFAIYWSYNQPRGTKCGEYDAQMEFYMYKNNVLGQKGACQSHVTYFLNSEITT